MSKVKILFFSANPRDKDYLDVKKEYTKIQSIIERESPIKDLVEVIFESDVQPKELKDLLLKHKPHIVHFTGHGDNKEIILINELGESKPVDKELLKHLLGLLKDSIKIVVLNACGTDSQAQEIADVIGCAVGIKQDIEDEAAIIFAHSFYKMLASGYSIRTAFDVSKIDLQLRDYDETAEYVNLYTEISFDPTQTFLVKRSYKGHWIISDPLLWNNYVTILDFAKHTHHIYQTLLIDHLSPFITNLDAIQEAPHSHFKNFSNLLNSWEKYNQAFSEFSKELDCKFLKDESVVIKAFEILLTIEDKTIRQALDDAKKLHYAPIKQNIKIYSNIHNNACNLFNKEDIYDILTNPTTANQAALFNNIEFRAKRVLTESDNLLRSLITFLLQE